MCLLATATKLNLYIYAQFFDVEKFNICLTNIVCSADIKSLHTAHVTVVVYRPAIWFDEITVHDISVGHQQLRFGFLFAPNFLE